MQQTGSGAGSKAAITVVGGGLGGTLMAIYLGRAGHQVSVYERRSDPRQGRASEGRSINLAISTRGLHALEEVGMAEEVLRMATPMRGRMMHSPGGDLSFQPYGTKQGQVINSVSRHDLSLTLLNAAEQLSNVRCFFGQKCSDIDLRAATAVFLDAHSGELTKVTSDIIVGADGAFSVVRHRMQKEDRFDYQQMYLEHGYKELSIPARADGSFAMDPNALHIWPRGGFMMIALPNRDATFTCTCFWPHEGPAGFAALGNEEEVLHYFRRTFPDAVPLMPTLARDFIQNPTGSLVTIRCSPWYYQNRVVLLGDACHAVVPFYGQGANAAFEDCTVLNRCLLRHAPDWEKAFAHYQSLRKRNTDTLADLSLGNFIEMRDRTTSSLFLVSKRMGKLVHGLVPHWFVPLYTMVTFSRMPYAEAVLRARRQRIVLWFAGAGTVLLLFLIFWIWVAPWN